MHNNFYVDFNPHRTLHKNSNDDIPIRIFRWSQENMTYTQLKRSIDLLCWIRHTSCLQGLFMNRKRNNGDVNALTTFSVVISQTTLRVPSAQLALYIPLYKLKRAFYTYEISIHLYIHRYTYLYIVHVNIIT